MPFVEDSSKPAGTIAPYGGTTAPSGFLLCNGASVLRSDYPALFAAIGTSFGAADGTHFNVPDFQGRFLRGWNNASGRDPDIGTRAAMNTGGNSGDNIGSIQGSQYASHTHQVGFTNSNNIYGAGTTAQSGVSAFSFNTNNPGTSQLTDVRGGNETRPINAYVNYIIKI